MDKFTELLQFRSLFHKGITKKESFRIWGKECKGASKGKRNIYVDNKVEIAKKNVSFLLIGKLVKFIGISGSVGSGFAKEEDDIDIFVVTRNGGMWLYRALVQIKNVFHRKIRIKGEKNVKDKFCLNLITEEKGLKFDNDIFNFNELMYLIPIYNEKYINYIYSQNRWLETEYKIKKENMITKIKPQGEVNILMQILNTFLYCLQLIYMKLARHRPDLERIRENSKKGRIEFFPKKFREKKVNAYKEIFS
jgi:predicted nucleotidyltransferase